MNTTTEFATPAPLPAVAIEARMHAQPHYEIEAQQTDDTAALSAARRVVALLDAPAPADATDSVALTIRSVEALAAVYGLLADAEEGLLFAADRDGVEWAVGPHYASKGLVAWNVFGEATAPITLAALVADHGPLALEATTVMQMGGFAPVDLAAEAAARIMSLLLHHGVRATAVAHDNVISVWNPIAPTTEAWNRQTMAILGEVYGVLASADNPDGALEIALDTLVPIPATAPAAPADAWMAVRRNHSPYAEGIPEWKRDGVVLAATDLDEIAYRIGRGDELLPMYADGEGTLGAADPLRLVFIDEVAQFLDDDGEATR